MSFFICFYLSFCIAITVFTEHVIENSFIKYIPIFISNVTESVKHRVLRHSVYANKNITRRRIAEHEKSVYFSISKTNKTLMRVVVFLDQHLYSENTIVEVHNLMKSTRKFLGKMENDIITTNYFYSGYVIGDRRSSVAGFFQDGIFNGVIHFKNEDYFIESGLAKIPKTSGVNGVMYTGKDFLSPNCTKQEHHTFGYCVTVGKEFFRAEFDEISPGTLSTGTLEDILKNNGEKSLPDFGYSQKLTENKSEQKICNIELVADHTFFRSHDGNHQTIIGTLLLHVSNADAIFRQVDFDGDSLPDNIGFIIKKISIYEDPRFSGYPFAGEFRNARDYIMAFTYYRQDVCVAIAFTNRHFENNQVGIAFVASPHVHGDNGGICDKTKFMQDGTPRNLNIAIISTMTNNQRLPTAMTSSTVVHEIGHAFGSLHDQDADPVCSPKGWKGSYIMSPYTNDGSKPNNKLFSRCSVNSMREIVRNKGSCLEAKSGSYCGNAVTEDGEECDCGAPSLCHMTDPCCTPSGGVGKDPGCTYRRELGRICSPKSTPCCTENCTIANPSLVCHSAFGTCSFDSFCNGTSTECPVPEGLGEFNCSSKICTDRNLKTCHCSSGSVWECFVCCLSEGKCVPAIHLVNLDIGGLRLPVDTVCSRGRGTCDSDGRCIVITKKNQTSNEMKLKQSWYYIFASIAALLVIIMASTKFLVILKRRRHRAT